MNREILCKIFEHLFPVAQAVIEQDHQQHAPMLQTFKVVGDDVAHLGIAMLSGDEEGTGRALKQLAKQCPADCVCVFIDECYIYAVDLESETPEARARLDARVALAHAVGPRNMPGRKEAILFSFFGRDWEASSSCEILREPDRLVKGPIMTDLKSEGRLAPHG